ncbi:glycoside hydrolase family protein [Planctomycetota bacterium]
MPKAIQSEFCQRLKPVGRLLEDPDYNVWGCSPILGPDERIHVFYSKWPNAAKHQGWLTCCEIGHAVADRLAGPYQMLETAFKGRSGDWWDAMTCHNPTIHKVGDQYALFYMGTQDGTLYTKRIGIAVAESLNGPWQRSDEPLLLPSANATDWDSMCTTNPSLLQHPNGQFWLYYKSWNRRAWDDDLKQGIRPATSDVGIRTNRQYGLAIAESITGPYRKVENNPIIDLSIYGGNKQCEDGYVFLDTDGSFKMLMRDMGFYNHEYGLMYASKNGIKWGKPTIAFLNSHAYFDEPRHGIEREGRLERPQLLMKDNKPIALYCALVGGRYNTSSGVVLQIHDDR